VACAAGMASAVQSTALFMSMFDMGVSVWVGPAAEAAGEHPDGAAPERGRRLRGCHRIGLPYGCAVALGSIRTPPGATTHLIPYFTSVENTPPLHHIVPV
jgi:hypothetical protein